MDQKINTKMKSILLNFLLLFAVVAAAQSPEEYLEESVKLQSFPLVLSDKEDIFHADIINVVLSVNLGDAYNDAQIAGTYILKGKHKTTFFESMEKMYNSTPFLDAFNTKINGYEDAARLSSFFLTFNSSLTFGYYFNIGNIWYFTTSDGGFFGADGFIVTCADDGTIETIEMQYGIEFEMPEEARRNESNEYKDLSGFTMSPEDNEKVLQELKGKADYSFTTSPAFDLNLGEVEVLNGELTVSEKYDDMESTGKYPFLIIKHGDGYIPVSDKNYLLDNDLYRDAVKTGFTLKTDADAQNFRMFLDKLVDADPEVKSHKKVAEEAWFFANSASFGDTLGVLVLTNESGKIEAIAQNSGNTKVDILRLKMESPGFVVDYEFKLVYPDITEIETTVDQKVEVEISFNEDFVNAADGWIATIANGKNMGMSVSSEGLSSPFGDQIPAGFLGKGKHTVEYLLMKPGNDYENPLSKITLTLTVK
jgi:hypothetical protein